MHTLNILSLNVNGLNSAVKRTRVLEYLHLCPNTRDTFKTI